MTVVCEHLKISKKRAFSLPGKPTIFAWEEKIWCFQWLHCFKKILIIKYHCFYFKKSRFFFSQIQSDDITLIKPFNTSRVIRYFSKYIQRRKTFLTVTGKIQPLFIAFVVYFWIIFFKDSPTLAKLVFYLSQIKLTQEKVGEKF